MINLIQGDCVEQMMRMRDESFDLIITSPPYKDEDGFTKELMSNFLSGCLRLIKKDGLFFMNFGHLAGFKGRPFEVALFAESAGFTWSETFVWVKNHYRPIQGERRVNNLSEFIFLFHKGKTMKAKLDRLAVGEPYVDHTNAKRFNSGKEIRCAGNLVFLPYETITKQNKKLHNDRFPESLPEWAIKLSGKKTGKILDPFVGSGTTLLVAERMGFDSTGIELSPSNIEIIKERCGI